MNNCPCEVVKTCPDLKIYQTKDGVTSPVQVTSIDVDTDGKVVAFKDTSSTTTLIDDSYKVVKNFLEVPGVGYLTEGTKVCLDTSPENLYYLGFGWHTNVSNQTIYGWYLSPIIEETKSRDSEYMTRARKPLAQDRTLYRDMIDHIWTITV